MAAQQQAVELDFLGVHEKPSPAPPIIDRRRCFRGIQNALSKIDPAVVKSVIASASGDGFLFPSAQISASSTFRSKTEAAKEIAPMTIFHNGTVTVFDVSKDQAESILQMAKAVSAKTVEAEKVVVASSTDSLSHQGDDALEEGLPHYRRKSLERFFQKRKERLMSVSPYENTKRKNHAVSASGPNSARGHWGFPATTQFEM